MYVYNNVRSVRLLPLGIDTDYGLSGSLPLHPVSVYMHVPITYIHMSHMI